MQVFNFQILFDFKNMFPSAQENALMDKWKWIEKKPFECYKTSIAEEDAILHSNLQLHNFFTFIKLMPAHKIKFKTAVKSFMIYSEVKYKITMAFR